MLKVSIQQNGNNHNITNLRAARFLLNWFFKIFIRLTRPICRLQVWLNTAAKHHHSLTHFKTNLKIFEPNSYAWLSCITANNKKQQYTSLAGRQSNVPLDTWRLMCKFTECNAKLLMLLFINNIMTIKCLSLSPI